MAGDRRGEDGVRHVVAAGPHVEQLVEDDREHDHRQEGLQDRPGHPQHGLLVADEDVAPGEEVEQLAVLPQLPEPEPHPPLGRPDDQGGHRRATSISGDCHDRLTPPPMRREHAAHGLRRAHGPLCTGASLRTPRSTPSQGSELPVVSRHAPMRPSGTQPELVDSAGYERPPSTVPGDGACQSRSGLTRAV